ncbi:xanthine dehydrogenase iron-sulfur cluster and FAD-binding subunit A [Clostridium pascui]|uniref:FAD binding domain-containing protein n=1 Tax=Clostridium pascui TaxID=46609 RepID=UPI00195C5391|nr:FAD binding domain-containing protein [Clostridium pascui]MBM7870954.1 xanthine dehydrogenase iron-sulfur cluster and FAD-binding subunit A [Clostridium pascui]
MVEIYKPKTLKEVLQILNKEQVVIFAGGTDLMVKRKQWSGMTPRFEEPIVFIADIYELKKIERSEDKLTIGSAVTYTELIESLLIPEYMKNIFKQVASPAIRNIGTIGGNIGNSSPVGDTLPLLYALEAKINLQAETSKRQVDIKDFILGPGVNDLKEGELITSIEIPLKDFSITDYHKVGTRKSTALAKLSFLGITEIKDNKIHDIRISFGAVAPTIVKSKEIENRVIAQSLNGEEIDRNELIKLYDKLIRPIDDQRSTKHYRKAVCLNLLNSFLDKIIK